MSAMIALAAGLGTGYLQGIERDAQRKRQDKLDAQQNQEFEWKAQEHTQKEQDRQAMRTAGQPIAATVGADLTLADGTKKAYDMPNGADIAGSDFRQMRSADQATGQQTLAPGAPIAAGQGLQPVDMPAAPAPAMSVAGKRYGTPEATQQAVDAQNTPEARSQRFIAALEKSGNPLGALQLQSATQQGEAAKVSLEQMKANAAHDKAFRDVVTQFQTGGWPALPKIYEGYKDGHTATVQEDGKGGVTVTRIGPDGQPVGSRTFASPMDFISTQLATLDPKLWVTAQDHRESTFIKKEANKEAARHNSVMEGNAGKTADAALIAANAKSGANQGKPPVGYRPSADGNLEAIPGGPADTKLQGALNADTAQLNGSIARFDRLATAANEVLNHPGLPGITGLRGALPNLPGSNAANAQALLATLKSQVGFGVLQDMRNNSKTGGALGSVSDAEGKRLEANLAALEKSQSMAQFQTNLKKIVDYADQAKGRVRDAFNLKHQGAVQGSGKGPQPAAQSGHPTAGAQVKSGDGSVYVFKGGNPNDPKNWEVSK